MVEVFVQEVSQHVLERLSSRSVERFLLKLLDDLQAKTAFELLNYLSLVVTVTLILLAHQKLLAFVQTAREHHLQQLNVKNQAL